MNCVFYFLLEFIHEQCITVNSVVSTPQIHFYLKLLLNSYNELLVLTKMLLIIGSV